VATLTNADWGKIHAKAWTDPKFRKLLERDPTKAIKAYGKQVGKSFQKMVRLKKRPKSAPKDPVKLARFNPHPPSCC
jgi:hypothetical protein